MHSIGIKSATHILLLSFCCLFVILSSNIAHAQLPSNTPASLSVSPNTPAPFSEVTVSLDAYSINTTGASIRWYADGVELPATQNARSVFLTVGDLGDRTVIRAAISLPTGATLSASKTIIPATIDLIVEADTLVPSFYKGRALPVGGEPISVIAIPQFGGSLSPSSYSYLWKLDQTVLFGGAVKGKYRMDTAMPLYGGTLSVVVYNAEGAEMGSAAINLTPVNPELYFYEENALRGLSTKAVAGTHVLLGDESTFRAEPYFIGKDIFSTNPVLNWSIDGRAAITNDVDPATITLRKEGGSGSSNIRFSLINGSSVLQQVSGAFNLYFE